MKAKRPQKEKFLAISKKTFRSQFLPAFEAIARCESTSIHFFPLRDQIRRMGNISDYEIDIKRMLPSLAKHKISFINLYEWPDDEKKLELFLSRLVSKQKHIIVVIGASRLLTDLKCFAGIIDRMVLGDSASIKALYFFEPISRSLDQKSQLTRYSSTCQNSYFYRLLDESESLYFIEFITLVHGIKINNKNTSTILRVCGGNMWLMTQCVRSLANHQSLDEALSSDGLNEKLQATLDELPEEHSRMMHDVCVGSHSIDPTIGNFVEKDLVSARYLQRSKNGQLKITIPLLAKYIKSRTKNIHESPDGLRIRGKLVSDFLSSKEQSAFKLFYECKNTLVDREKIASHIWGSNFDYSDWALDKFVSRLKMKLIGAGLPKSSIKTSKGIGYTFIQK